MVSLHSIPLLSSLNPQPRVHRLMDPNAAQTLTIALDQCIDVFGQAYPAVAVVAGLRLSFLHSCRVVCTQSRRASALTWRVYVHLVAQKVTELARWVEVRVRVHRELDRARTPEVGAALWALQNLVKE